MQCWSLFIPKSLIVKIKTTTHFQRTFRSCYGISENKATATVAAIPGALRLAAALPPRKSLKTISLVPCVLSLGLVVVVGVVVWLVVATGMVIGVTGALPVVVAALAVPLLVPPPPLVVAAVLAGVLKVVVLSVMAGLTE